MIKKILLITTTILGVQYASTTAMIHKGLDHGNTQQNKRPYPAEKHIRVKQRKTQGSDMKKQKEVLAIIDGKAIYEISSIDVAVRLSDRICTAIGVKDYYTVANSDILLKELLSYEKKSPYEKGIILLRSNLHFIIQNIKCNASKVPLLHTIVQNLDKNILDRLSYAADEFENSLF